MRVTLVVLLILLGALAWSNPDMDAFKAYTEGHAERLLLRETGDTKLGRLLSEVGGSLAGTFVDRISERKNYVLFSLYTIDLDGDDDPENAWRFLGIAGQFMEVHQPGEGQDQQ